MTDSPLCHDPPSRVKHSVVQRVAGFCASWARLLAAPRTTSSLWALASLSVFALLAILYVLAISRYWKISPDSTSYVSAAYSLASGQGYRKAGEAVLLYPPVTSLLFSIAILLFPGSYLALNALVTAFTLLAHAASFVLLKKRLDTVKAAVPVLLSLGSIVMFSNSTKLLSDIIYLCFSMVALALAESIHDRDSEWSHHLLLALMVGLACMTRIAGLTLVAAIFLHTLVSRSMRKGRRRLLALMFLVALAVGLWELRGLRLGASYVKLALQNEPWVEEAGYASPLGLLRKFYRNLDDYLQIGDVIANDLSLTLAARRSYIGLLARGAPVALLLLGLARSIRHRMTVTNLYSAIHLLVVGLYYPYIEERFLLPVVPLLFHYGLVGVQATVAWARLRVGPLAPRIAYVGLFVYGACFLRAGVAEMLWAIPREHTSPFGAYPIKYEWNYDAQRLAMWVRDNAGPGEALVCHHADVMVYLAEREAYAFPFSSDPAKLLDLLEGGQVRYVLADKKKAYVRDFLLPAIQTYPDRFKLIQEEERASLYEFELQP